MRNPTLSQRNGEALPSQVISSNMVHRFCTLAREWRALALLVVGTTLTGCVTAPPTARTASTGIDLSPVTRIAVLPLDVEVAELAAGGMTEKRDDWTAQVVANLNASLTQRVRCHAAELSDDEREALADELRSVQALYRAITVNQVVHGFAGPRELSAVKGPLVYEVGRLDALMDAADADAVLLLFVRDDYATGGRKALVVLGVMAGIPIRGGVTISSAALAQRDGKLVWMNHHGATSGDLRTAEGADAAIKTLFAATPAHVMR